MQYYAHQPGEPLNQYVDCVWLYVHPGRCFQVERVLPTGAAQLIVNLAEDRTRAYFESPAGLRCEESAGVVLAGPRSRYELIDTLEQSYVAGIAFRPGGTRAFVPCPADVLADTDTPLGLVGKEQDARRLREQLLEASGPEACLDALVCWLRSQFRPRNLHPAVEYGLKQFDDGSKPVRIARIATECGMSHEGFARRFRQEVGFTPARYGRVLRFQRCLGHGRQTGAAAHFERTWTDLAAETGYSDQAHLIHDFREFAGITPSEYLAQVTAFANHVDFLQSFANKPA